MNDLREHLARRTARAALVMVATLVLCASTTMASDPAENPSRIGVAILFAVAAGYFAVLSMIAHARSSTPRVRDSVTGMMVPALGHAAAIPASIAVPLLVFDMTSGILGPASPPFAILSGMITVFCLMLVSKALEDVIDPPTDRPVPRNDVPPGQIVEDMP